jgi:proline dehydrogenase
MRALFLAASENRWLREHGVRAPFVRRAVSSFMPGETFDDMLRAAERLPAEGIHSVFTRLGENVADRGEAQAVADHYVAGIERIREAGLSCEPSVKPTQLGLDIDHPSARAHLLTIAAAAEASGSYLWVDMEQSSYVDVTLNLVEELRARHAGVGVCLQAYLHRTREDLARMIKAGVGVRLVKGAYREPPALALPDKRDVDANYVWLGRMMLDDLARCSGRTTRASSRS